jgi:hypothetical protein
LQSYKHVIVQIEAKINPRLNREKIMVLQADIFH